jgi:L-rhamnose mutarotase
MSNQMDDLEETGKLRDWQSELVDLINRKKEEMEVLKKLQDTVNAYGNQSGSSVWNDIENSHDESGIER